MKRMLWILNPYAGRGAMSGKIIGCVTAFQQAGYDVTIYITQGAQDATRVARERAGEFDRIVCAGGDGTLNEVITGLMQAETRPVLGYVPAGTTNDFAFSLGISKVPAEAAVIAAGDTLQALDIGRFNDRYFNYVAAFGAFTEVSYETPQQTKNIFGRAAYIIEGIKALTNIKTYHIRVNSAETQMEDDFIYGMVTNTVSVGGFKTIRPDGQSLQALVQENRNMMEFIHRPMASKDASSFSGVRFSASKASNSSLSQISACPARPTIIISRSILAYCSRKELSAKRNCLSGTHSTAFIKIRLVGPERWEMLRLL